MLLIFDEVQTGVGRTGKFFAHEWSGVTPDIMAVAKGIGGGFPLGACLATAEAAGGMTAGTHASTFGGNPLAMAVGNAVLDHVLAPDFLPRVQKISNFFRQQLGSLIEEHPHVFEEIRGEGLLLGLKLKVPNTEFAERLRAHHMLAVGAGANVLRLIPPLIVTEDDVREAIKRLSDTAAEFDAKKAAAE
jgi:acetylornithine/N-succinyldiaminopimelate aminotransferase